MKEFIIVPVVFLVVQSVFLLANYMVFNNIDITFAWDASWYGSIMEYGYQVKDHSYNIQQNIVFFPLYPLIALLLKNTFHLSVYQSQYLLSSVLFFLTLLILYRLFRIYASAKTSSWSLSLFAMSPFSIYLLNGYSESLWVLLVVLFFFCLTVFNKPWGAAVVAGLASATRPYGILLVIFLFLDRIFYYRRCAFSLAAVLWRSIKDTWKTFPVACSGIAIFVGYLWLAFDDPLAFVHGQKAWESVSGKTLSNMFNPGKLLGPVIGWLRGEFHDWPVVLGCIQYVVAAAVSVWMLKKNPYLWSIFSLFFLAFLGLILNHFGSIGRFTLILFPVPLGLTLLSEKLNAFWPTSRFKPSDVALFLLNVVFILLYFNLAKLYFQGEWVA